MAAETNAAEDAIRHTAQQFVEAYDHGNAKDVAALWTPDGEYAIGHDSIKGRDTIAKLYEAFFRAHPGSKMKVNVESVRMLAPTVAIEQGTASTSGGPGGVRSKSAYTAVHVKQDGKWLMASVRESESASDSSAADLSDIAWLIGSWEGEGDASKIQIDYAWMANKHFIKGQFTSASKDGNDVRRHADYRQRPAIRSHHLLVLQCRRWPGVSANGLSKVRDGSSGQKARRRRVRQLSQSTSCTVPTTMSFPGRVSIARSTNRVCPT